MTNPAAEVVRFCSELIQIDTSNYGPGTDGPGERAAAEYVAAALSEVGLEPELYEAAAGRTTVVARWEPDGVDTSLPPLLLHGHLDVVPAVAADWSVDPFAGEVKDGYVYGRGAVDMKDFDAMLLSVVRERMRTNRAPRRPIRLVFPADEEAGGRFGGEWLVDEHPETISDCTQAVGEVGGFSLTPRDDARLYLIQIAEKGIAWLRLVAEGRAGHGSMRNDDNAVTELARAVARLGEHQWPYDIHPAQQAFLDAVEDELQVQINLDTVEETLSRLGSISRMVGATMSHSTNPTMLEAGYKVNVIPGQATAQVDGRFLPGRRDAFLQQVKDIVGPKVRVEISEELPSVEAEFAGALVEAMKGSLAQHDPAGRAVPYMMSGGTDAKSFQRLGMQCYGFVPLRLPPELDFVGLFHGIDERVPVESLEFGCQVLDTFLDLA